MRIGLLSLCGLFGALSQPSKAETDALPSEIQFRRQAVTRMMFDDDQRIHLASLRPAKIIDLNLMHPEMLENTVIAWQLKGGALHAKADKEKLRSQRWVGGFNPFACYDMSIHEVVGNGSLGISFTHGKNQDHLSAKIIWKEGKADSLTWTIQVQGKEVSHEKWQIPAEIDPGRVILRAQMSAVGVNLFVEQDGHSHLVGYSDFSQHFDLRERVRIQEMDFRIHTELEPGASASIAGATSFFSPGSGQADIRAITNEEGEPLLDDGRLWFTITVRGRGLPHPLQGVFSLNPSVFDLKFEGIIVFDMNDGLYRNDLASHLFRDSQSGEWRGWTTGFSALDGAARAERKSILAVHSTKDPRRGFSLMKASPVGIDGAHEDPHGIYDPEAKKWRMLLCEHGKIYRAGMWESDHWDHGFKRLAGPVEMDSTGTMIQKFGSQRYALFGSADRKIYIRHYPDLSPAGELRVDLPPWNEKTGTRIWPNVIPMPDGYPAPYIALMMDRVNIPGMPKQNWTYGALYLYHGHPTSP